MEPFEVTIVGGGPAGSSCAAFCVLAGLRTLVLERETFPREKVCGDCLNPSCWPVLERLDLAQQVRNLPHSKLDAILPSRDCAVYCRSRLVNVWRCKRISRCREILAGALFCNSFGKVTPVRRRSMKRS